MDQELELVAVENSTPITTSYIMAEKLGIEHRSLMHLIRNHQSKIEKHFGVLRFENAKPLPDSQGGRPEQSAILTETQAHYILTLSRNTEKAMEVKALFVKAFDEAKQRILQLQKAPRQQRLPHVRQLAIPERGFHVTLDRIDLTPEQERALIVEYVERLWDLYGEAVTATMLIVYLKRFSTGHLRQRMTEASQQGELERFFTPHTERSGGKFKPARSENQGA